MEVKEFDTDEAAMAHAHELGYSVFSSTYGAKILKCTQHGVAGATQAGHTGCIGGFGSRMRVKQDGAGGKV